MLSIDEEICIEGGVCADALPQYFERVDGTVRVRGGFLDTDPMASAAAGSAARIDPTKERG
jgi:hypothetical protein